MSTEQKVLIKTFRQRVTDMFPENIGSPKIDALIWLDSQDSGLIKNVISISENSIEKSITIWCINPEKNEEYTQSHQNIWRLFYFFHVILSEAEWISRQNHKNTEYSQF